MPCGIPFPTIGQAIWSGLLDLPDIPVPGWILDAADNGQQQPQQPSWAQKYLSCVVSTAAEDTAWGGIVGGAIGIGGTAIVTGAGAVAGSELGPGGTPAGAGLGFALSSPFIVPAIAEGAIAGAETGLIHGGIACLWGG